MCVGGDKVAKQILSLERQFAGMQTKTSAKLVETVQRRPLPWHKKWRQWDGAASEHHGM